MKRGDVELEIGDHVHVYLDRGSVMGSITALDEAGVSIGMASGLIVNNIVIEEPVPNDPIPWERVRSIRHTAPIHGS